MHAMSTCGKAPTFASERGKVDGVGGSDLEGVEQNTYAGVLATGDVGMSRGALSGRMHLTVGMGQTPTCIEAMDDNSTGAGLNMEGVEQ